MVLTSGFILIEQSLNVSLNNLGGVIKYSSTYLIVVIGGKSYGFRKSLRFKSQPCNRLYPKKPAEMHW